MTRKVESLVKQIRADPNFKGHGHEVMSCLKLDPAGEWRNDNENFQEMANRIGLLIKYSSPDDKRSHAHGENAVKQLEITTRSILLNRALPTSFVEDAAHQAAIIRNLYPLHRDCVSGDGDAIRPLEAITRGRVSRRQIDNRLHHLIPLGTPCLIYSPKTKSSNLQLPKARWGIALRLDQDMPIFFCPFRGPNNTFRSKNYIEYTLGIGINYYKFLGIDEPIMPNIHFPSSGKDDIDITTITQIDNFEELINEDRYGPPPIQSVRDHGERGRPLVIITDQHGWIYETDDRGDIIKTDRKLDDGKPVCDGVPISDNDIEVPTPKSKEQEIMEDPTSMIGRKFWKTFDGYDPCEGTILEYHTKEKLWTAQYSDGDQEDFDLEDLMIHVTRSPPTIPTTHPPEGELNDEPYEHRLSTARIYSCKEGENFFNVCDSIGIALHLRKTYYEWLGHDFGLFGETWDPMDPSRIGIYFNHPWNKGARTRFRQGTNFPIPHGSSWSTLIANQAKEGNKANPEWVAHAATTRSSRRIIMSEWLKATFKKETKSKDPNNKKKPIIDDKTGKITNPKNMTEAMARSDKELWKTALIKELDALDELGVLSHDHTMKEVRGHGILTSAVPMQLLFDVKYHPDGSLDKYKVRNVVNGHKGYMRRGEHFFNTFSASPSCKTTRLMQALTIGTGLHRYAWDICTAYLWAEVREDERIPIRYPKELRRYDDDTGEELYAMLLKNCYGMPQADRRYTQLRNQFILTKFNEGGWSCKKSRQDPCLFIFSSPTGHKAYVIIHTDDCDGHGESLDDLKYIAKQFHERFKIKVCDPRFMLGVKREIYKKGEITEIELTQPDFIETTYNTFKDECPSRTVHTPFPPKLFLHSLLEEHDNEISEQLIKKGYQSLAGSILWAARNCYPEASLGANMICRLMSKPTMTAWKGALHIIKYLHGQSHRGVKFRSDGNKLPVCYYDASNKSDPSDGKSQYGYVIFMFNGPIAWNTKKFKHVGLSSTHNEYMALCQASKDVEWLRQMLHEIGYPIDLQIPTPMMGDNDNATLYAREDLITPANKFIIQEYHFAKECFERMQTCPRRVDTTDNISDVLTKSVARPIHDRLVPTLTGYGEKLPVPPPPPKD